MDSKLIVNWLWRITVLVLVTGACWQLGQGAFWLMNTPQSLLVTLGAVVILVLFAAWVAALNWFVKSVLRMLGVSEKEKETENDKEHES